VHIAVPKEAEVLEYDADAASEQGDLATLEMYEVEVAHSGFASVNIEVGIESTKQRGLPSTTLTNEIYELPCIDLEVDMGE
jgi:hypothetical protein